MASTYSPKLRLELIGAGEQAGLWGTTTNKNVGQLLEQAIAGVSIIELDGISGNYTITALDGTSDQARSAVLQCIYKVVPATGSINLIIPTQTKLYVVRNDCGQIIYVKTVAQTGGIEIKDGESTLVFCDGTDAVSGIETAAVGTLTVSGGGTGSTTFTAGFVKSPGGTGALTSSANVNLGTEVTGTLGTTNGGTNLTTFTSGGAVYATSTSALTTGTLPVASGGTGKTTLTSNGLVVGNGTSAVTSLVGTSNGQVATWNGTAWIASAAAAAGVASFSAGTTGFTPSTAATGAVTLAGTLSTGNGGTGLTTFGASNRAIYSTSSSALTAGTLPVAAGGTGSTTLDGAGIVTKTGTQTISGSKTFSSNVLVNLGSGFSEVRVGTSTSGMSYDHTGTTVGIGFSGGNALGFYTSSTSTGYAEFSAGTVKKPGGGSFTASSDIQVKENVVDYTKGLEALKTLRPVNFNYNDVTKLGRATSYKKFTGLVAQETEKTAFNSIVDTGSDGYKFIDSSELTYALINAVKELAAQVETLKAEIATLKGE